MGTICVFGFNYAPYGWALCQGQIMPISRNTALFSLIGTYYGGNGTTTFALPDLQVRGAIHMGALQGGSTYVIGEQGGADAVTITTMNMPAHNHALSAAVKCNNDGTGTMGVSPVNAYPAKSAKNYCATTTNGNMTNAVGLTLGNSGGTQPIGINDPSLVMNYSIALQGIFPMRN